MTRLLVERSIAAHEPVGRSDRHRGDPLDEQQLPALHRLERGTGAAGSPPPCLPDAVVPDRETGAAFVWVLQLSYRQGRTPQLQIGLLFQLREGPHRPVVRRAPLGSPGGALSALGLHPAVGAAAADPGQPSGPAQRVVSSRRRCGLESQRAGTHPTRAQEPALAGGQTSKPALLARPDHRLAHLRVRPQMEPPSPYDRHRRRAQRRRRSLAGRPPCWLRSGS